MENITEYLKQHLIDTTASSSVGVPLYAVLETLVLRMSPEDSLRAKFTGVSLGFLGLGTAFARGRDYVRKKLNVNEESSVVKRGVTDAVYGAMFSSFSAPVSYSLAGADSQSVLRGTLLAMAISLPAGFLSGLGIDYYRGLFGIKESNLVPDFIDEKSDLVKKGLAGMLTLGSAAATALYYTYVMN